MALTPQTGESIESHPPKPTVQAGAVLGKALIFLAIAVAGLFAYRYTALKEWLQPTGEAAAWVRATGLWGTAVFLAGMPILILLGVPRLLFCPLAGALYGFWGGLSVSAAGTIVSYYAAFRIIRGRRADGDSAPPLHRNLTFLAGQPGLTAVIVSRILPVPGMIVTLALSMSNVRTTTYLLGSLLGLFPEAAPLVLLGAGMLHPGGEKPFKLIVTAFACIIVAWLAIHHLVKRFKNGDQP